MDFHYGVAWNMMRQADEKSSGGGHFEGRPLTLIADEQSRISSDARKASREV